MSGDSHITEGQRFAPATSIDPTPYLAERPKTSEGGGVMQTLEHHRASQRNTAEVNQALPFSTEHPRGDRPYEEVRNAAYRYLMHNEGEDKLSGEGLAADMGRLAAYQMPDGTTALQTMDKVLANRKANPPADKHK